MSSPWLPAVSWGGDYPGTQKLEPVGRTVRKKRSAKRQQVEKLAEQTITLDDVDVAALEQRPAKKAKLNATVRQPEPPAPVESDGARGAGDGPAEKKGRKKRGKDRSQAAPDGDASSDAPQPAEIGRRAAAEQADAATPVQQDQAKPAKKRAKKPHVPTVEPTGASPEPAATSRGDATASAGPSERDGACVTPADRARPPPARPQGSSKLAQMRQQLQGGRFRMLNEKLYSSDGAQAFAIMQATPELFEAYHDGFRAQTKSWETNPVDVAIRWLRGKPAGWVVADFGCGDAALAQQLGAHSRVHSFDLVARNERVTACNMSRVPLEARSCDAAVFSLALMGTDYPAFLAEARRVLKLRGFLWIAEVRSRFVPDGAVAEDFQPFLAALKQWGFALLKQDASNRMFVVWVLSKMRDPADVPALDWPKLKPCIYKRR